MSRVVRRNHWLSSAHAIIVYLLLPCLVVNYGLIVAPGRCIQQGVVAIAAVKDCEANRPLRTRIFTSVILTSVALLRFYIRI